MNASKLEGAIRSTIRLQDKVYHDMLVPEAARGNDNTLWQTYRGGVATINRTWAFADQLKPIELIEVEMRFQWRIFILTAKYIDFDHPAQDRLTWLILWTREVGVLSRRLDDTTRLEQAITSRGRIWKDLPFLLQDVQKAWKDLVTSISPVDRQHCHNLTAAIARLAAVGLLDNAFSGCGFEIMRQTFETSNMTVLEPASVVIVPSNQEQIVNQKSSRSPGLTVPFLLSLVRSWLHYAGRKLLQLSSNEDDKSYDQAGWSIDSELTVQTSSISGTSLSATRFRSWMDELIKLKEQGFEDEACKETAEACLGMMEAVWNEFFGIRS